MYLDDLTLEQLEAERARVQAEREALGDYAKSISAAINRKIAAGKLASMTGAERQALLQVIGAAGVASGEQVGGANLASGALPIDPPAEATPAPDLGAVVEAKKQQRRP